MKQYYQAKTVPYSDKCGLKRNGQYGSGEIEAIQSNRRHGSGEGNQSVLAEQVPLLRNIARCEPNCAIL
jgi:hypothetical protein